MKDSLVIAIVVLTGSIALYFFPVTSENPLKDKPKIANDATEENSKKASSDSSGKIDKKTVVQKENPKTITKDNEEEREKVAPPIVKKEEPFNPSKEFQNFKYKWACITNHNNSKQDVTLDLSDVNDVERDNGLLTVKKMDDGFTYQKTAVIKNFSKKNKITLEFERQYPLLAESVVFTLKNNNELEATTSNRDYQTGNYTKLVFKRSN